MNIARGIDRITNAFNKGHFRLADRLYILERDKSTYGFKDWAIINAGLNKFKYKGEGELVAILDTGVDTSHQDLIGRVELVNFIPDSLNGDENGHGTFNAGLILAKGEIIGVAPEARGLCYKVLCGDSRDGSILDFELTLYNAIRSAYKNGCGVISMSLGFNHKSRLVEEALAEAVDNGVIPIAACGNDGMIGSPYKSYPASYSNCISVSSANEKGLPTWFSSTGVGEVPENQPEIAVASQEYYWGCLPHNSYGSAIGTSQSCPIIAGTAILWRESIKKRGLLPKGNNVLKSFRNWLKTVAVDTNHNGWDSSLGWGVLSLKDGDL